MFAFGHMEGHVGCFTLPIHNFRVYLFPMTKLTLAQRRSLLASIAKVVERNSCSYPRFPFSFVSVTRRLGSFEPLAQGERLAPEAALETGR